jgi:hypothetical protein
MFSATEIINMFEFLIDNTFVLFGARTSLSPIWRGFPSGFVNYKKGRIRLTAAR